MSTNFQFRQLIRLKNLNNASYNGKLAHVENFPSYEVYYNGRYRVNLIDEVESPTLRSVDVKPENMQHACNRCHKGGEDLMLCGKCRHVRYCDGECQRIDWKRHKEECDSCGLKRDASKNPLLTAVGFGDLERVRELVEEGIDVNMASNTTNFTALQLAAGVGCFPIVQYLLQHGADKNKADNNGHTALFLAAGKGCLTVVKSLVEQGADKDKASTNGASPLYLAAKNGHFPVVQCLVDYGADKDKATNDGRSPFFTAAQKGHLRVVEYLLDQGADMNKTANNHATPLHVATHFGHAEVVSCLLRAGASLTARDCDGDLPIDVATNEQIKQLIRDEEKRRRTPVTTEP